MIIIGCVVLRIGLAEVWSPGVDWVGFLLSPLCHLLLGSWSPGVASERFYFFFPDFFFFLVFGFDLPFFFAFFSYSLVAGSKVDAGTFGAGCAQIPEMAPYIPYFDFAINGTSEDCLFLNVFTPTGRLVCLVSFFPFFFQSFRAMAFSSLPSIVPGGREW